MNLNAPSSRNAHVIDRIRKVEPWPPANQFSYACYDKRAAVHHVSYFVLHRCCDPLSPACCAQRMCAF